MQLSSSSALVECQGPSSKAANRVLSSPPIPEDPAQVDGVELGPVGACLPASRYSSLISCQALSPSSYTSPCTSNLSSLELCQWQDELSAVIPCYWRAWRCPVWYWKYIRSVWCLFCPFCLFSPCLQTLQTCLATSPLTFPNTWLGNAHDLFLYMCTACVHEFASMHPHKQLILMTPRPLPLHWNGE